jgi:hypothetical protein
VSWQLAERMPDGRPFLVTKLYNWTLRENSNLRNDAEVLMGPLSPTQIRRFDAEWLIGRASLVSVSHTEKPGGKVYANADQVLALPKGTPAPVLDGSYVRKINRPQQLTSAPRSYKNGAAAASLPGYDDFVNGDDEPTAAEADRAVLDRAAYEVDQGA